MTRFVPQHSALARVGGVGWATVAGRSVRVRTVAVLGARVDLSARGPQRVVEVEVAEVR